MSRPWTNDQLIRQAKRLDLVKNGLVVCEQCGTPVDGPTCRELKFIQCAPCIFGEADAFDDSEFVAVEERP